MANIIDGELKFDPSRTHDEANIETLKKIVLDKKAKAAYLWNKEKQVFISYDDQKSLRKKGVYVHKNRLGGIVIWEYTGDYKGQLTKTIRHRFNRII